MDIFLKRILLFIFPILLVAISLELLVRNIPNDYSYKKKYLDKNAGNVGVLFLGNSHAYYGLNPEYCRHKSFNAAYVSQSLDYDLAILKKYDKTWDSLKYIVVPVDYFSLYSELENSTEAWRTKDYKIYYGINRNFNLAENTEIFSTKLNVIIGRVSAYYRKDIYTITCSKLGWGCRDKSEKIQDLLTTGEIAAQRHYAANDLHFSKGVEDLTSIIRFGKTRNINVVLFTSPSFKTYVEHLNSNQLEKSINAIIKLSRLYDNVTYFNLLNDSIFLETDFFDADHLNDAGAKKLTIKMDSLLTQINNQFPR